MPVCQAARTCGAPTEPIPMSVIPSPDPIMDRAATENFPVASRLLPATAALASARDLRLRAPRRRARRRAAGRPARRARLARRRARSRLRRPGATHPLLRALAPTIAACGLSREPFERLIEANRVDQRVHSYETWEELLGYCNLSANPVGELVLRVFGAATPERIALSDAVCTALQLTEHWQDVGEDLARGRVYLPLEDLARHGCTIDDLAATARRRAAAPRARARGGAHGGAVSRRRRARGEPATAGRASRSPATSGGGRAALEAIALADYEVLALSPRPTPPTHGRRDRPRAGPGRRRMSEAARRYCAQITRRAGRQLLLRDAPAARATSARRCSRSTPSRGASTTSATARCLRIASSSCSTRRRGRSAQRRGEDPVLVALRDAQRRFPLPRQSFLDLIDGRAHGRRRRDLRALRRARRLLPARRRLDRAAVRRGLRQRRRPRRRARRRPRRRAAADEHPARRPRGRRARTHLPAGRGPRALRRAERGDDRRARRV